VAAFAALGTTIATCLALGVLLGLYLDHLWHLAPVGLLLGIVLGAVAAVASVVKLVRRFL
jgi:F0F1-type ATP synthase assembly protein I